MKPSSIRFVNTILVLAVGKNCEIPEKERLKAIEALAAAILNSEKENE